MLFLIFAATILPGILGCCFPDKFSGNNYVVEQRQMSKFVVDYTQKKVILRPQTGPVDFILNDLTSMKIYTKNKDGSCKKSDLVASDLQKQCLPQSSFQGDYHFGPVGDLPVSSYRFTNGHGISVTKSKCMPVMALAGSSSSSMTILFANVTDTNVDVSDLNQDISNCA